MADDRSREQKSADVEGEYEPPTVTPLGFIDQLTGQDEVTSIDDTTTVI